MFIICEDNALPMKQTPKILQETLFYIQVVWHQRVYLHSNVHIHQGTHCTRKTGKWQKEFPVREKTGNLEILPKHRENTEFGLLQL